MLIPLDANKAKNGFEIESISNKEDLKEELVGEATDDKIEVTEMTESELIEIDVLGCCLFQLNEILDERDIVP